MDNQTSLFNCSVFNCRPILSDKSNKKYLLVTNTARAMQNFYTFLLKSFSICFFVKVTIIGRPWGQWREFSQFSRSKSSCWISFWLRVELALTELWQAIKIRH